MPSVFQSGMVIHEFTIDEIIGSGAYGTVMRATATTDHRVRALKAQPIAVDAGTIQNECFILQLVDNHPGCLKLFDVFQAQDHQIFELQLLGPSLHKHIDLIERLSLQNTVKFVLQMLDTLQFLQSKSILHRDITSQNLCLSPDFHRVVLCDFGISTIQGLPADDVEMHRSWHSHPAINEGLPYDFQHELFQLFLVILEMRGQVDLWLGATLQETIEKKRRLAGGEDLEQLFDEENHVFIQFFSECLVQHDSGVNFPDLYQAIGFVPADFETPYFDVVVVDGQLYLEPDV